jgi:hypothetical protein
MGRMLLAYLTPIELEALYAGKELPRFSDHTPTTLAALRRKAQADRVAGIAWSEAHFEPGIASAAVPVFDFAAAPVGAINVSGPTAAFAAARSGHIGSVLRATGAEISRRLGWLEPTSASPGTMPPPNGEVGARNEPGRGTWPGIVSQAAGEPPPARRRLAAAATLPLRGRD